MVLDAWFCFAGLVRYEIEGFGFSLRGLWVGVSVVGCFCIASMVVYVVGFVFFNFGFDVF